MKLTEFISAGRVRLDLQVASRAEALPVLAALLASGLRGVPVERIVQALDERERALSTALGDEVAVPHARLEGGDALVGALVVVPAGVDWCAPDGRPARVLCAFTSPATATVEHLQALAAVSRVLRRRAVRQHLLAATTPEAACRILIAAEEEP